MSGNERLRHLALIVVASVLLIAVFPAPARAATGAVPVLALRLDAPVQNARVTESAPGTVTFTGQVSIDKLPVERCVVTLTASTDTGWPVQVSPLLEVFTSTRPRPFTCSVIVPPGTLNSQSGNLSVRGRGVAGGLHLIAETRGLIMIEPVFRPNLSPEERFKQILPGQQALFTLRLSNTGNAMDSFELEIINLGDLCARRWTVVFSCGPLTGVSPGGFKPFRITAQSPRDGALWTSEPTYILVKATSQSAKEFEQVISTACQLTIYVRGTSLPDMDPAMFLMVLALAAAYNATVNIRAKYWRFHGHV